MSRTLITAAVAGVLFASAWWIFIDAFAYARKNDDPQPFLFTFLLPGALSTLGLLMYAVRTARAAFAPRHWPSSARAESLIIKYFSYRIFTTTASTWSTGPSSQTGKWDSLARTSLRARAAFSSLASSLPFRRLPFRSGS